MAHATFHIFYKGKLSEANIKVSESVFQLTLSEEV